MNIAVIGAGRIGGNIARRLTLAGHHVTVSFSRDHDALRAFAEKIGADVVGTAEAAAGAEVVVISVPWGIVPAALEEVGSLDAKIVIDTTNQFGPGPMPEPGQTAASFNASRMPGARYTKSFNTLTSAFQAQVADRAADQKVVRWLCGDDDDAKQVVAGLIADAGYVAADLGGTAECSVMEAPRRPGAVYGEEYRLAEAQDVVRAARAGDPIPPTPTYAE